MKKWEYKVIYDLEKSVEEILNELGRDGWELINVSNGKTFSYATGRFIFKRIKL